MGASAKKFLAVCSILTLALILVQGATAATPGARDTQQILKKKAEAAEEARRLAVTAPALVGPADQAGGGAASLAPLVILYDQTTLVNLNAASQDFETAYDRYDNQAADDFVVTAPGGWNVTSVVAPGVYSVTHGSPQSIRVAFYQDAGGVPGTIICDFPALAYVEAPAGTFTLTLPGGCLLTSGTRWVSVVANLNFAGGGGQWFWSTRTALTGSPSQWQNPGGGFATPCATWGTRTTCLTQTDPDMAFSLSGDIASCQTDPDCNNGNLCDGVETCVAGACLPGTPVNCDDSDVCTIDTCTPATGACVHAPNPCNDGDSCTVDSCVTGVGCTNISPPTVQYCNTGLISIPSSGPSTPYPAAISVSGLGTVANLCSVQIQGLSHTWPSDIDILLAGPLGGVSNAIIMSDVAGSTAITGVSLTLKDAAATSMPTTGPLLSGTYKPTNSGTGDTFAAPAPTPAGGSALSVFNGTNPNGSWQLYVVDDAAGDSGTIATGWCVNLVVLGCSSDTDCNDGNLCNGIETCVGNSCRAGTPVNCDDGQFCTLDTCIPSTGACAYAPNLCSDGDGCTLDTCDNANGCAHSNVCIQYCNQGGIAINDGTAPTPGTPYPSSISISGLGSLALLGSVQLQGLSHTFPLDIDMLLVGPAGGAQNAIIMSDVGGTTAVTGVNLTLTDSSSTPIPTSTLVSGTYQPTNSGTGDVFPAPAPPPAGGSALSVFTGNPNGTWDLYVLDDANTDSGTMTGWCVNIRPTCNTPADCDDGNPCTTDTCVATLCQHTNNTNPCDDGNPCTVGDVCSGGTCSGTLVPTAPVGDSLMVTKTASTAHIDWNDPPGPFNVYRGSRTGSLLFAYNQTCFALGVSGPLVDDAGMPPAGTTFYYLVSRKPPCGESVLGFATGGIPIPNSAPCP